MYRIMLVKSKRDNFASLYQWLTEEVAGEQEGDPSEIRPVEFETEADLDVQVEKMLNEDGYAKQDFIVVKYVDYTIDATDYDI